MPIFAHLEFRCKRVEGVPDDVKAFLENSRFDAVVRGPHWPAGGEADDGEGEAQYYGDIYCCDNADGTSFSFYRRPFDPVFELGEDEEPLGYTDFDRPFVKVFLARRATSERKLQLYVAKTGSLIGKASTSKPDPHPCTPNGREDFHFCARLAPNVWSRLAPFLPYTAGRINGRVIITTLALGRVGQGLGEPLRVQSL